MELTPLTFGICAFALWGSGVSIGRYFPAAQPPDGSLATKITNICSHYQPVQDSPLCQTIFTARFSDGDWIESPSGRVPQEKLDAEFLNFVSFRVHAPQQLVQSLQQNAQCTHPANSPFGQKDVCSRNEPYLRNGTQEVIQALYVASQRSVEPPKQSKLMSSIITLGSWTWQWLFFVVAGIVMGKCLDTRWIFWIWVTAPWMWFIRLAPANYVLIWNALASFAIADMDKKYKYPISRTWLVMTFAALVIAIQVWLWIKSSREIQVSLIAFLVLTVPLEPIADYYWPTIIEVWMKGVSQAQATA